MRNRRRLATPRRRRSLMNRRPRRRSARRRRRVAYTDSQRRMDELTEYLEAMDGYMRDGRVVLSMLRQGAPYYDDDTEEYMLMWLDKAVSSAREFQNSMSGLVSIANNIRRHL